MTPIGTTHLLPVLGRAFWMIIGPCLLLLVWAGGIRHGGGWLTIADFAFLAMVGGLVLARWFEFRGGSPKTSTGERATWTHFQRYAMFAIPVGFTVWVLANLVANHWPAR